VCEALRRARERGGGGSSRLRLSTSDGGGPGAGGVMGSDVRESVGHGRWWAWSAEVYSFWGFFPPREEDEGVRAGPKKAGGVIGPSGALHITSGRFYVDQKPMALEQSE
jgi:hypothetical protein